MSVKQDRMAARTATDLERKYQFGKTFAEIIGLIDESRDKVDSVESSLRDEILAQYTTLKRDAEQIAISAVQEALSSDLSSKVEMILNSNALNISVTKVETETGYKFGADGLDISKSGEEMSNKLDHTGMYVKRNDEEILTANSDGVDAVDLHAKTYLIIGSGDGRSRFEDYGINRTACFWVGG